MTASWGTDPLLALLVEDAAADAELLVERLASADGAHPVRLLRAGSVGDACQVLGHYPIDVALLDLGAERWTGLEALRRVRACAPGVPVVVLASPGDEAGALAALRAGAQDYLLKPPPDGPTLRRILRYARERQHLYQRLDAAVRVAGLAARRWRLLAEVDAPLSAS